METERDLFDDVPEFSRRAPAHLPVDVPHPPVIRAVLPVILGGLLALCIGVGALFLASQRPAAAPAQESAGVVVDLPHANGAGA